MTAPRDAYHLLWLKVKGELEVVHAKTSQGARERARRLYPGHEELSIQSQSEFLKEMRP